MIAIEMPSSSHDFAARILSGQDRSLSVRSLRSLMAITEPIYSTAMLARNAAYDRGILQTRKLPRPTVSVGNITTGGTGKTPVVIWLANRLREAGRRPAVLLRGYRATAGFSDEQQVLNRNLNQNSESEIPVKANPNRIAGAAGVLHHHPNVDTFVLDDAFQHRKVHRNFDLVLINATDPFGYNHVLPRGLLREPLSGLGRATAFLLTHMHKLLPMKLRELNQNSLSATLRPPYITQTTFTRPSSTPAQARRNQSTLSPRSPSMRSRASAIQPGCMRSYRRCWAVIRVTIGIPTITLIRKPI